MILCLFEIKLEDWCQKDFYQSKNAIKLSINTQKMNFHLVILVMIWVLLGELIVLNLHIQRARNIDYYE